MSQTSPTKKPLWDAIGNPYNEANYVASAGGWKYQPTGEIVVSISNMLNKIANIEDIVAVPTFTYTGPDAGDYLTDAVLTFTLTPSEPVSVIGYPIIPLVIGSSTKYAMYSAVDSNPTSLVFKYTVVDGDLDIDGIAVSTTLDKNDSIIYDTLPDGTSRIITEEITYTVPADVITINVA